MWNGLTQTSPWGCCSFIDSRSTTEVSASNIIARTEQRCLKDQWKTKISTNSDHKWVAITLSNKQQTCIYLSSARHRRLWTRTKNRTPTQQQQTTNWWEKKKHGDLPLNATYGSFGKIWTQYSTSRPSSSIAANLEIVASLILFWWIINQHLGQSNCRWVPLAPWAALPLTPHRTNTKSWLSISVHSWNA